MLAAALPMAPDDGADDGSDATDATDDGADDESDATDDGADDGSDATDDGSDDGTGGDADVEAYLGDVTANNDEWMAGATRLTELGNPGRGTHRRQYR